VRVAVSQRCGFTTHFPMIRAAAIMVLIITGQIAQAADGDLDPTFGTDGKVLTDFDHSTDIANAVAVQTDGKLVVVGTRIARYFLWRWRHRDNDFSRR